MSGYGKDGSVYTIPTTALPSVDRPNQLVAPQPSENVVMLVCDNCGFVRLHRYEHIRRWIELHPEDAHDDRP